MATIFFRAAPSLRPCPPAITSHNGTCEWRLRPGFRRAHAAFVLVDPLNCTLNWCSRQTEHGIAYYDVAGRYSEYRFLGPNVEFVAWRFNTWPEMRAHIHDCVQAFHFC